MEVWLQRRAYLFLSFLSKSAEAPRCALSTVVHIVALSVRTTSLCPAMMRVGLECDETFLLQGQIWRHIGSLFATIQPSECNNYFANAGYASVKM
jgi:hypothetical protein